MPPKPNTETYAPELLLELITGKKPDPRKLSWLAKDFRADFGWTGSGGSWNHWQILAACALWSRSGVPLEVVIRLIVAYLEAQAGEDDGPNIANFPMLRYFGGTEQLSNTYEGWRWGFVLAVRLWALRHPKHPGSARLLRLTARYSEVQTALLALGAAPGPTKTGMVLGPDASAEVHPHAHRSGRQVWWQGPSLPMAGARSTPAHLGTDDRMPYFAAFAYGKLVDGPTEKRFGWTARVLREVQRAEKQRMVDWTPVTAERVLAGIRLAVPHHFITWSESAVRLNYMERLVNGNTTSILAHVHYDREDRAVYLFPWPGRIRSGLGEASAGIEFRRSGIGGRCVVARSRFGEESFELPDREPDWHFVCGPDGCREVR